MCCKFNSVNNIMLNNFRIIKRLCHHSRTFPETLYNPLLECEKTTKEKHRSIDHLSIDHFKSLYPEEKTSPIQIHYYNNNELYKITTFFTPLNISKRSAL